MNLHTSVLLNEVIAAFSGSRLNVFIDGTLGLGGHSEAILTQHPEIQTFIGIDQDPLALKYATDRLSPWKNKIHLIQGNFKSIKKFADSLGITQVDGILFDLGVSSIQFDEGERGFSFMKDGPLDMRMDTNSSLDASMIVNTWSEAELSKIFREYGEEAQWKQASRLIIQARQEKSIKTTHQLVKILEPLGKWHKRRIHPATLVFQALRIAVNDELNVLDQVLPISTQLLGSGGKMAIISFHSKEDRRVKEFFRESASDKVSTSGRGGVFLDKIPKVRMITRKPIMPSEEEIERNPRSRSAKMRVIEKL